jgi:hypothetical protein
LKQCSDLRSISVLGHVVFGHFAEIAEPTYEVLFTVSNFEAIKSNARLALMVTLQFNATLKMSLNLLSYYVNVQRGITPVLMPVLQVELEHILNHKGGILSRRRDLSVREVCGMFLSSSGLR